MKIALIGTHGTGKSTIVYDIVNRLKRNEINAEPLKEVARKCPLPINENTSKKAQEWVIYKQYVEEIEEEQDSEILVCDRSIFDGYAYYHKKFGTNELLEHFIKEKIKEYEEVWRVPISFSKLKDDGFRSINKEFQENIDKKFDELTSKLGIEYKEFKSEEEVFERIIKEFNNGEENKEIREQIPS